ncbi:hypothetical protein [Pseudomonas antarctica]|uniref:hypothetical protein n=1 Tax=Pseudomonas antarctica TaxID=219572 RepID=UPI003F7513EF
MAPTQVMTQDQFAGGLGVLAIIGWGDVWHVRLLANKRLRLPNFRGAFNGTVELLTNGLLPEFAQDMTHIKALEKNRPTERKNPPLAQDRVLF